MPPSRANNSTSWLQIAVFVSIPFVYLFFAPNYQWKLEETGTAYGADFLQEWTGARMIITGHVADLYDLETFKAWQYDSSVLGFAWITDQYFPPVYPPPHYVLFSPLACLPYRWAVVVWLVVLVAAAFFSTRLITEITVYCSNNSQNETTTTTQDKSRYLWLGLVLFPMLLFSITLGQKSVIWLLIACGTWRLLQCHRDYLAGMVFGILSVKPTLFFLVPLVLLRRGNWRFFVGASISFAIIWGGTACVVPVESWMAFGRVLGTVGTYAENAGYRLDWSCNLLTIAYSVPTHLTIWCKWAICAPLAIYLLYCVFEDRHYAICSPEMAMMLFGSTLLISPHTYQYDLCILLLPILCLSATATKQGIAYFGLLTVGVTVASEVQSLLHLPVVTILLIAIICELRLRGVLHTRGEKHSVDGLAVS